ncbi:MAG: ABC transporter ATP-binding protein [Microcoleaceae cyanobacterium]
MSDQQNAVELINLGKLFTGQKKESWAVNQVNLQIKTGEFFSILGPSGCGKTTTLRMIAGFEQPTCGDILIEQTSIVNKPPFHRPVNTVFQNYALFPHLNVWENIAFGLEMENLPKSTIQPRVNQALAQVQLSEMAKRYPRQLSGGQQQRVALARALVKQASVLLFDEPLGALDLKLRKEMQLELKHIQKRLGLTFIYVTHDQEEALTMSDRIAVMYAGQVLQVGTPIEIYEEPQTKFVAEFIGETNFLMGRIVEQVNNHYKVLIDEKFPIIFDSQQDLPINQIVTLVIRPEKIDFAPNTNTNQENILAGIIEEIVYIGTDTRYLIRLTASTRIILRQQNFRPNQVQKFTVNDPVNIHLPKDCIRAIAPQSCVKNIL